VLAGKAGESKKEEGRQDFLSRREKNSRPFGTLEGRAKRARFEKKVRRSGKKERHEFRALGKKRKIFLMGGEKRGPVA